MTAPAPAALRTPLRSKTVVRHDGEARTYHVQMRPALEQFAMGPALLAIVGPALGELLDATKRGEGGASLADANVPLGRMVALLAPELAKPATRELVQQALQGLMRDVVTGSGAEARVAVALDVEFQDNLGVLLELAAWALWENVGSFFSTGPAAALSKSGLGARLRSSLQSASRAT